MKAKDLLPFIQENPEAEVQIRLVEPYDKDPATLTDSARGAEVKDGKLVIHDGN